MSADASPYGLGEVHADNRGIKRPVYFASIVLSSSETNYSQIEKEGLAIAFALKHFQIFLSGRHFTLNTDNRSVLKIFGQNNAVSLTILASLQRCAIFLSCFDFTIGYNKIGDKDIADRLSRHLVLEAELIDSEVAFVQVKNLKSQSIY